ncbi:Alpha/Beta hydrolase protein [Roridomyces roridus]|uniref:Carboxylic ester hydrolase n=1 Tax=Roridomyces roridus TaxID=1738132 RepID=A0AAD7BEE6_9AGAR|nr:Alpha/Beta hydrolase protein [Roridomyces roridus]
MLPILLGVILSSLAARAAPLSSVTLDYGTFTGSTNRDNGLIYFEGIRYADPPVGALRWRAPVSPPSRHLGHVHATKPGFACIADRQTNSGPTTDEDCLFGNVFVPIDTRRSSKLPVLVYFYGGGFESGRSQDFPPENIVLGSTKPLIFVTFNYRLGQFGFLSGTPVHEDGELNVGLLDQRAALEWVQSYISKFGGDPSRVTIWGQSSGAGSVMFHLIAEGGENKHLFHQAMGDSPPLIFMAKYNDKHSEDIFSQFAHFAGCGNAGNGRAIMACLRDASTHTIATAGKKTLAKRTMTNYRIQPVLDGSFLRQRPVEAFRAGNFVRVPTLFGSNTDEGAHWSAKLHNPRANTSEPSATETTVYNFIKGQYASFSKSSFKDALLLYPLAAYDKSFSLQGQQMFGEMRFICTALMITDAARKAGLRAYQYHYDNPILGSDHAAELSAFFNGPTSNPLFIAMQRYWTSFVTSGEPVARSYASWKPSGLNSSPRLLLHPREVRTEVVPRSLTAHCAFWHSLASEILT